MGSRREEERNEKVIRGLMKLPPNRRCIDCNSMGPQYVCSNFWTFVCMTCSGIHREFTHRVKSVSMSKFTSQEVEALQAGGNQRAREVYLKNWDYQRQKFPNNSNVEKIRDFIKSVYVDQKYTGGSLSDKPPRDLQSVQSPDNDTRRASSYHSYSQSPPYDFQYEDRVYKKQNGSLSRKPGSDRGIYAGKLASFISSPTRFSEDGFANENSGVRLSDFSVSSGGDTTRQGAESPVIQKDSGSFTSHTQHPKRTVSCGSILPSTFEADNSNNILEVAAQVPEVNKAPPSAAFFSMDLFEPSTIASSDAPSSSMIDLFQLPGAPAFPSETIFHPVELPSNPLTTTLTSFAAPTEELNCGNVDHESDLLSAKNDGWANFDSFQPTTSVNGLDYFAIPPLSSGLAAPDKFPSKENPIQWPPEQNLFPSDPWKEKFEIPIGLGQESTHMWNAFDDDSFMKIPPNSSLPVSNSTSAVHDSVRAPTQHPMDLFPPEAALETRQTPFEGFNVLPESVNRSFPPLVGDHAMDFTKLDESNHKSTNPFDLPFDSDSESSNLFLDMSNLQPTLPNSHSSPFLDSMNQQWFPQDSETVYTPTAPQGGATFTTVQTSTVQLGNMKPEGPVVSIGGNPFA